MSTKRVAVRFSAEGGDQVRAAFEGVGESGEREMRRISASVEMASRRLDSIGRQMQVVGGAITAAGAAAALAIRSQINAADDMGKAAQRLGVPVEALSQLRYAAELSGVSVGSLDQAIQRLSRQMVDGADKFAALGVQVRGADGELRGTVDVIADVADVLAEMPDGAEKTALMIALMGRSAADLIPLLNQGGGAMREAAAEADRLGITISDAMFRASERTNDAITRMQAAMTGLTTQIVSEMAPMIADLAEWVSELVQNFAALEPETQRVIATLTGITIVAGPVIVALGSLLRALASIRLVMVGLVALSGPLGIALALLTAGAAAWLVYRSDAEGTNDALDGVKTAQEQLNEALGVFASTGAPQAGREAIAYAQNLEQQALAALAAAEAEMALLRAKQSSARDLFAQNPLTADGSSGYETDIAAQVQRQSERLRELEGTLRAARETLGNLRLGLVQAGQAAGETAPLLGQVVVNGEEVEKALRGAGGGASAAASAMRDDLKLSLDDIDLGLQDISISARAMESVLASAFDGIITQGKTASDVLRSLARSLESSGWRTLFGALFGGGGGGGPLSAIPWLGSFEGGGSTGSGARTGGLDGRGGQLAILHPNETVIDHERGGMAGLSVSIAIDARGSVEGEAERFARYMRAQGKDLIEAAVARAADRRSRGYKV